MTISATSNTISAKSVSPRIVKRVEALKVVSRAARKVDHTAIDRIAGHSHDIGFTSSSEALPTIQQAWREVGGGSLKSSPNSEHFYLENRLSNETLLIVEPQCKYGLSQSHEVSEHLGPGPWANTSLHHDATNESLNAAVRFVLLVATKHPLILASGSAFSGKLCSPVRV